MMSLDGDLLQVEQVDQHRMMLGGQVTASFEHQRSHFLLGQLLLARLLLQAQRFQHCRDEQVDEPDDRIGELSSGTSK